MKILRPSLYMRDVGGLGGEFLKCRLEGHVNIF